MSQEPTTPPALSRLDRHEINNRLGTLALAIEILRQNPAPDVRDLARKMEAELEGLQRLLREGLPWQ